MEGGEAAPPQLGAGSRAAAEFGTYGVRPRWLRGHKTGRRREEGAGRDGTSVNSQHALSR